MSSFAERLAGGEFPIALEVIPPITSKPDVLIRRASIDEIIATFDVVQRTGRQNSLEAAAELAESGRDPIWHLATNGTSLDNLSHVFELASNFGLNQVLVIQGDEPKAHKLTVAQAIRLASDKHPGIFTGVAFNQYAQPLETQIRTAAAKSQAGAAYIQTQPIFDFKTQQPIFEALKAATPNSKLVAMCMPLISTQTARSVQNSLGIPIGENLHDLIESDEPETGWNHFQSTLKQIAQSNLFDGLVIMTYEMDPSLKVRARIGDSLKLAKNTR